MKKSFVFISFIMLIACSHNDGAYNSEEAIEQGDVVYQNGFKNIERLEAFIENMEKKKVDSVRITAYTHEGDPIFQDLHYNGKAIEYRYDNSFDQFAGEEKGVKTDICNTIIKKDQEYVLSGCEKLSQYVLP